MQIGYFRYGVCWVFNQVHQATALQGHCKLLCSQVRHSALAVSLHFSAVEDESDVSVIRVERLKHAWCPRLKAITQSIRRTGMFINILLNLIC